MIKIMKTMKAPSKLMVEDKSGAFTPALCLQVFENGTVVPVGACGDVWRTEASFMWDKSGYVDYREPEARRFRTLFCMPERLALQLAQDALDAVREEGKSCGEMRGPAYLSWTDAHDAAVEHVRECIKARDRALAGKQ